tara:strand:+ start:215 stop:520 length:306 start_codon:yes stop_codon:yes gene_type:complete
VEQVLILKIFKIFLYYKMNKLVLYSSLVGVILNIVLAIVLTPFATADQIKPPNGAAELDFFSQIMHMIVHHGQVLFTSSLIIFVVVLISTLLGTKLLTMTI